MSTLRELGFLNEAFAKDMLRIPCRNSQVIENFAVVEYCLGRLADTVIPDRIGDDAGGGDAIVRYGTATSNWIDGAIPYVWASIGGESVKVNLARRYSNKRTGDPNVRTGAPILVGFDETGIAWCISHYLDNRLKTVKFWTLTDSPPTGWAVMDGDQNSSGTGENITGGNFPVLCTTVFAWIPAIPTGMSVDIEEPEFSMTVDPLEETILPIVVTNPLLQYSGNTSLGYAIISGIGTSDPAYTATRDLALDVEMLVGNTEESYSGITKTEALDTDWFTYLDECDLRWGEVIDWECTSEEVVGLLNATDSVHTHPYSVTTGNRLGPPGSRRIVTYCNGIYDEGAGEPPASTHTHPFTEYVPPGESGHDHEFDAFASEPALEDSGHRHQIDKYRTHYHDIVDKRHLHSANHEHGLDGLYRTHDHYIGNHQHVWAPGLHDHGMHHPHVLDVQGTIDLQHGHDVIYDISWDKHQHLNPGKPPMIGVIPIERVH